MTKLKEVYLPEKQSKIPLKRSMTGYETEQFVLLQDGSLDHGDTLYKKAKGAGVDVQQECAKAMIELSCLPAKRLKTSGQSILDNLSALIEVAESQGKILFPFGTYFGKNSPQFRRKQWYTIQKKILGEDAFENAGLCCGFHQHYTLPRGVFNLKKKFLQYKKNSKINRVLIDSYNFLTAIDPILITLTQSSPYVNNHYVAKNSRVLLYRGGNFLGYKKGMYANHKLFGGLSPYKMTVKDLLSMLRRRHQKWRRLMIEGGFDHTKYVKSDNILNFTWNPVKINAKGTIEYRGSDMNYLSILLGVSVLVKFSLRKIQQDYLKIVPLDIDVKEAFKIEDNMLFIPPFSVVNRLQKRAIYEGLENDELHTYISRFLQFVKEVTYESYQEMIAPIESMVKERKTTSDKILDYFSSKGYRDVIPDFLAHEAALHFAEEFKEDLKRLQSVLDVEI